MNQPLHRCATCERVIVSSHRQCPYCLLHRPLPQAVQPPQPVVPHQPAPVHPLGPPEMEGRGPMPAPPPGPVHAAALPPRVAEHPLVNPEQREVGRRALVALIDELERFVDVIGRAVKIRLPAALQAGIVAEHEQALLQHAQVQLSLLYSEANTPADMVYPHYQGAIMALYRMEHAPDLSSHLQQTAMGLHVQHAKYLLFRMLTAVNSERQESYPYEQARPQDLPFELARLEGELDFLRAEQAWLKSALAELG